MAKVMAYTDPATGAAFPASVWLPMGLRASFGSPRRLAVVFEGYADLAALAGGLAPVGTREYSLDGVGMLALVFRDFPGPTVFARVSNACYAAVTDDFFATATDVEVSLT